MESSCFTLLEYVVSVGSKYLVAFVDFMVDTVWQYVCLIRLDDEKTEHANLSVRTTKAPADSKCGEWVSRDCHSKSALSRSLAFHAHSRFQSNQVRF